MLAVVSQVAVIVGYLAAGMPADWPPEPNFEKPVDYYAWYERWVAGADGPEGNAFADYLRIFPGLANFDPTILPAEDPDVFPNIAGPMADAFGEPIAWSLGSNPRWMAASKTNVKRLAEFAAAVRKPYVLTPSALMPDFKRLGIGAQSLSATQQYTGPLMRSRWAVIHAIWCRDGDHVSETAFVHGIETMLELARQFDRSGECIGAMMAVRLRGDVVKSTEAAMKLGILGRDSRATLLNTLTRLQPQPDQYCRIVIFDCAYHYDEAQRLERAQKTAEDEIQATIAAELDKVGYTPRRLASELREYFEQIIPQSTLPTNVSWLERLKRLYEELRSRPFVKLYEVADPVSALQVFARGAMQYHGLRLTLALHVYRDVHGEWPESLDMLMNRTMIESLTDPLNGEPFVYRIESGEPLLYSIGADANDEGGNHEKRAGMRYKEPIRAGDYVVWPLERRREK